MYSYAEIKKNLGTERLDLALDMALKKFFKSEKSSSRLDALIDIYELSSDLQ